MISFNHLGNLGRLGNQMFQYAAIKGIAARRGYEFCIPPRSEFGRRDSAIKRDLNIYDVFALDQKNHVALTSNRMLGEKMHQFDENLLERCPDQIDLFGYYQTELYFKHIEDQIRADFSFPATLIADCQNNVRSRGSESIALHVRRGDYVGNPNHPLLTCAYYEEALECFPSNLPVMVFSDDVEWCAAQPLFVTDRFIISTGHSLAWDLCSMALCTYHVIANSSLSWWGAWLAKSRRIVAPRNWFHGGCAEKDPQDMRFGAWTWLENADLQEDVMPAPLEC